MQESSPQSRQCWLTREDIGVCAHGPPNEHWLPRHLVVHGNEGVVRGKGARAALAVHQQALHLPIHQVLLHLHGGVNVHSSCKKAV